MSGLADVVLIAHFAYVLFVVGGLVLIWIGYARSWQWVRKRWFRLLHLAAIGIVAAEALIGAVCPLTWLEGALRGTNPGEGGFLERWVHAILFWDLPPWVFTLAYLIFAGIVGLTFVVLRPIRKRATDGRRNHPA